MNLSDNRTPALEDGTERASQAVANESTGGGDDRDWILTFKRSLDAASRYQQEKLNTAWSRNYRAYANRHFNGSKYDTPRYRNRSKLFKPKTRMAVRKNDATAAGALFSTEDVVSIEAERKSDPLQKATAQFLHADLNYRLSKAGKFTGPNWFLTAVGARQDSQIAGICVSKQYWEFETRTVTETKVTRSEMPRLDPNGMPEVDEFGVPVMDLIEDEVTEQYEEVIADRPMITVIPPDLSFIDPTADWRDPIQDGGSFSAAYPMRLNDVEAMIKQNAARSKLGGIPWRTDIDIAKLTQGRGAARQQAAAVRLSREDGVDRYESRHAGKDNDIIWVYETFQRKDGEDYAFWTLGETILLSDPVPTREAYPAHEGARPYVRGLGALETHKTHPMAPVESWQPMQMEINDITNLNLDAMKMGISPITKIIKGRGVDLKAVQNRGPDAAILVTGMDDVTFDRAPSPDGSAVANMQVIAADFDALAGVFDGASVQTNRTLNETVGGMQLLAGSANSLTEYDLRIWVETWCEPVLQQLVALLRHYESDETAIAVSGEAVGLIGNIPKIDEPAEEGQPQEAPEPGTEDKPTVSLTQVMENLDFAQVSVRVNVGMGALDSRQKLEKLSGAMTMTKDLTPLLNEQGYEFDALEATQEVWGLCGYKDAARFFKAKKPVEQGPPPEVMIEQAKTQGRVEQINAQGQVDMSLKGMELQAETMTSQGDLSIRQGELSLEQQRFDHERRMDAMEMSLRRIEGALGSMMGAGQRREPTPF